MDLGIDVLLLIIAYFAGAFPTGLLVGKYLAGKDVREHGSKNIGATNVWRVLGWKYGLGTFLVDVGKAAGAVLLAAKFGHGAIPHLPVMAAIAVLAGNLFNVFLGFKGGKGVASGLGIFLALTPISACLALVCFIIGVAVSGYISVGSLAAAVSLPVLVFYFHGFGPVFYMTCVISVFVIWKHRANIQRLLDGTESKFIKKKDSE